MNNSKFLLFLFITTLSSCGFKGKKVDLIIHNAKIYSVDEAFTVYQAMAIDGDSIVELGPEREILNAYSATEEIDVQGASVYPGFIDAHSHLLGYGLSLVNLDVRNMEDETALVASIKKYIQEKQPKTVIGRGWDHTLWDGKQWPSRKNIEAFTENIPVILQRIDGHAALVNKAALDAANITASTKIEGGFIDFENGILKENAVDFIRNAIPKPTTKKQQEAIKTAAKNCLAVGLTTVCDAGLRPDELASYRALHQINEMPIRVYAMADPSEENLVWFTKNKSFKSDYFNLYSIKAYMDGSLGSRSAALLSDYHDDHGNLGIIATPIDSVKTLATFCKALDLQLNTHCIGDRALHEVLSVYSEHLEPMNDRRWRIEHVQVFDPTDLHIFKDFGVIPSVQPTHATSDATWIKERLGAERLPYAYAYQSLKKQLGWIPLGTDFPVEGINPLATFSSAVYRTPINQPEQAPILPKEALTKEEALRGITIWAAMGLKMENKVGSLEIGKKADFVVLSKDLISTSKENLQNIEVIATYLGGKKEYQRL